MCLQFYFFPTTRNAILLLQTSYLILEETAVCHCRWIDSLDDIIELLSCLTWKTCYMSENFCHSSCFWKAKFICNLEWHWTHETAWNLSCSEYFIKLQREPMQQGKNYYQCRSLTNIVIYAMLIVLQRLSDKVWVWQSFFPPLYLDC